MKSPFSLSYTENAVLRRGFVGHDLRSNDLTIMMHFAKRAPWWIAAARRKTAKNNGEWVAGRAKERRAVNRWGGNRREGKRERRRGKRERARKREKKKERKREGMEGGSRIPYTVTFVKGWLSPYTGNVRDGRYLYRVQLKNQECRFLSRLLYTPVVMGGTNTSRKWSPTERLAARGQGVARPALSSVWLSEILHGNQPWWPAFRFESLRELIKDCNVTEPHEAAHNFRVAWVKGI